MTIETCFGKITASEATLNDLALSLFRAAELARGVNVILDKEFTKKARSIYRGLEAMGYYHIEED